MLARLRRRVMVWLAKALKAVAARIERRVGADGSVGNGPPEHWLDIVRAGAPDRIQHDGEIDWMEFGLGPPEEKSASRMVRHRGSRTWGRPIMSQRPSGAAPAHKEVLSDTKRVSGAPTTPSHRQEKASHVAEASPRRFGVIGSMSGRMVDRAGRAAGREGRSPKHVFARLRKIWRRSSSELALPHPALAADFRQGSNDERRLPPASVGARAVAAVYRRVRPRARWTFDPPETIYRRAHQESGQGPEPADAGLRSQEEWRLKERRLQPRTARSVAGEASIVARAGIEEPSVQYWPRLGDETRGSRDQSSSPSVDLGQDDLWPPLPSALSPIAPVSLSGDAVAGQQAVERRCRVDREQQDMAWSGSLF